MANELRSETHPGIESFEEVNRDVLKLLTPPGKAYKIFFAGVLAVLAWGIYAWMVQVVLGIGVLAETRR